MTSNQIAYASTRIEQQKANELERTNRANEALKEESNRIQAEYNLAYEEYTRRSNDLAAARLELDKYIESQKLENAKYVASNDLWYKTEMARLTEQSQEIEKYFKEAGTWYEQQKAGIEAAAQQETARHNAENERLASNAQFFDWAERDRAIYQFDVETNFRAMELGFRRRELENKILTDYRNYELGLYNIGVSQRRNNILAGELDLKRETWENSKRWQEQGNTKSWLNTLFPYLLPTADAILSGAARALF